MGLGAELRMSAPTCSEMTIPNGMEMRITGRVVTLARNQQLVEELGDRATGG